MSNDAILLPRDSNQTRGLARYAIDFCQGKVGAPSDSVWQRVEQFHRDSVACALSAIAYRTNAPTVLRAEAADFPCQAPWGVPCFASTQLVHPEKAVLANVSAVREWDANGTNFGYNPHRGHTRGEFGHNDFYPVAVAGCQIAGADGKTLLRSMLCIDEIRGRLAEVFALKDHKIDHVLHGAIASAAVFGALVGATVDQIESAIGLVVAHYVPFRAIRAGHQLSDSKGASAAISSEVAVTAVRRALRGFVGPADAFRNPQAVFCLFEPPGDADESPFDLWLSTHGDNFCIMGMHFKLGLYEHQSAGAIQGLINLLDECPQLLADRDAVQRLRIRIYEPAFSIIGDPAKRDPQTRQSADHSMVYIIATLLRKAFESQQTRWDDLMLLPEDYDPPSLFHPVTRQLMQRIDFAHGGPSYDAKYPDGIPTQVDVELSNGQELTSGLVMYPTGHARSEYPLEELLETKFQQLTSSAVDCSEDLDRRLTGLAEKSAEEVCGIYSPC